MWLIGQRGQSANQKLLDAGFQRFGFPVAKDVLELNKLIAGLVGIFDSMRSDRRQLLRSLYAVFETVGKDGKVFVWDPFMRLSKEQRELHRPGKCEHCDQRICVQFWKSVPAQLQAWMDDNPISKFSADAKLVVQQLSGGTHPLINSARLRLNTEEKVQKHVKTLVDLLCATYKEQFGPDFDLARHLAKNSAVREHSEQLQDRRIAKKEKQINITINKQVCNRPLLIWNASSINDRWNCCGRWSAQSLFVIRQIAKPSSM